MKRYNMFNQVHKGLRVLLYETGTLLLHTDFTIEEESNIAMLQLNELLVLFDRHADTEDNFVLPVLEQFESSVSGLFAEEHIEGYALSNKLRALNNMFIEAEDELEKTKIGNAICVSFVEFMAFNLKHMAKEEDVINNLLWKYQTDEQLHQVTQRILIKLGPLGVARFGKWMIRGLNNTEIIAWLNEVKANAPRFMFDALLEIMDAELSGIRNEIVLEKIENEVVA